MILSNKTSKLMMVIVLSILIIPIKSSRVLANSNSPININKQSQFLEEKRISQSIIIEERQKNTNVQGMMPSKDFVDRENAEIKKENEIKKDDENKASSSEKPKSITKSASKKDEPREVIHKESVKKASRTNRYYKNTKIPIIRTTVHKTDRIPLSQPVANMSPEAEESIAGDSLLGQLETIKNLLDNPLSNRGPIDMAYSDIEMLERIVMAESGGEPYLGQIAVANVVLNRVKSQRYPSTLEGVIFQKSQFSPVKNGVIRGRAPNQSVKKAVAEALNGRMIVPENTLYFVNPVLATDQTVPRTKTPVKVIGSHTFYR